MYWVSSLSSCAKWVVAPIICDCGSSTCFFLVAIVVCGLAWSDTPCGELIEIACTLFVRACVEVEAHVCALPDIEVERLRKVVTKRNACGTWVLLVRFEDDVASVANSAVCCVQLLDLSDVFDSSCKIHVVKN